MPKLIQFVRNDRRPVFVNPEYVVAVEPYRDDITHSVIFTSGIGRGGEDSRNYVVLGAPLAVVERLLGAPVSPQALGPGRS
ncbi:MAG: hypothetical protein EON59_04930 [Alphaproteobacteria bacterium]|nr:MAG: hypothetical protein EON59_04930 [Alphaproteobacteria bacterium]